MWLKQEQNCRQSVLKMLLSETQLSRTELEIQFQFPFSRSGRARVIILSYFGSLVMCYL